MCGLWNEQWFPAFLSRERSEQPVHCWYAKAVPKLEGTWLLCPKEQLLWNYCGQIFGGTLIK